MQTIDYATTWLTTQRAGLLEISYDVVDCATNAKGGYGGPGGPGSNVPSARGAQAKFRVLTVTQDLVARLHLQLV